MLYYNILKYILLLAYLFQQTRKFSSDYYNTYMNMFVNIVGGSHQRRLLKYLLEEQNYNPLERPVFNDSHTLEVAMNLSIQQIMDYVSIYNGKTYLRIFVE